MILVASIAVESVLASEDELVGDQDGTQRIGLSNGIELVIVDGVDQQDNAQVGFGFRGREYNHDEMVQVWLILRAGTMYEDQETKGAAGVVEQIIRDGISGLSSDEIDLILGANGDGESPAAGGSFTSFDQSVYMAQVESGNEEELDRVLGLYQDILSMDFEQIDDGRIKAAIEHLGDRHEASLTPDSRARQEWLPYLMRGTPFGEHLPMMIKEQIDTISPAAVRRFGDRYYRPQQAMLLVLGDVESQEILGKVGHALGSIERAGHGEGGICIDGRNRIDVSGRAVMVVNPAFDGQEAAMAWFSDHQDRGGKRVDEPWSVRAGSYTKQELRALILERVAGEVGRYRLERLSTAQLDPGIVFGFDQIDLWGQVNLQQVRLKLDADADGQVGQWSRWVAFLVQESDRLHRDGATPSEITRARRSLLSRWHRDADDWLGESNRERMGLIHWLITTGRPVIDMVRWDQLATELMMDIRDDEIDAVLKELMDPREASTIVLTNQRGAASGADEHELRGDDGRWLSEEVLGVVDSALDIELDPIDRHWLEELAGPINEGVDFDGRVLEVSQYPEPGVWEATLTNGVELLARSMPIEDDRVYLCATIWDEGLIDDGSSERAVDAAMLAWAEPTTELRSHSSVQSFLGEHGISVNAKRDVGYVQLRVNGPAESFDEMMDVMYGLLDRPMIERDIFERWRLKSKGGQSDPVDRGIERLYPESPDRFAQRDPGNGELTLDDAQRVLTQIVRNGQVDIGIVGDLPSDELIERAATIFGTLVDRERKPTSEPSASDVQMGIGGRRVVEVKDSDVDERGAVIGYVADSDLALRDLRARILLSLLLNERLASDDEPCQSRANIGFSSALPGYPLFLVRLWGDRDEVEDCLGRVHELLDEMSDQGVSQAELEQAQEKIDSSISRYFDTGVYWSFRLSTLAVLGREVDDLWHIRQGYASIEADDIERVLNQLLNESNQFQINIVEE